MRVMAEGFTLDPVLERATRVSSHAGTFTEILHGTPPEEPRGWMAIPIVMKLYLLWMGDELRYALPYLDGTEKHQVQGLIAPPPDALDRIERLQTALRTPYVLPLKLTDGTQLSLVDGHRGACAAGVAVEMALAARARRAPRQDGYRSGARTPTA